MAALTQGILPLSNRTIFKLDMESAELSLAGIARPLLFSDPSRAGLNNFEPLVPLIRVIRENPR